MCVEGRGACQTVFPQRSYVYQWSVACLGNNKLLCCPACQLVPPSMNGFISGVESSGWLKHVRSVLDTAVFITAAMMEGVSVLVHCSDGWDRTAQTCALAQLLLDPYYRTIQGFQVDAHYFIIVVALT